MGRKRVAHSRRCRRRAMCSAGASWPQPSQGKSVGTAISKNGRARRMGRQMGESTVEVQRDRAAAKPGWYRGNAAAQPHLWLFVKPASLWEVAGYGMGICPGLRAEIDRLLKPRRHQTN